MKEPKQKNCTHFALTRDPILSRRKVEVLCGAALQRPVFVATFAVGKIGDLLEHQSLNDCTRCFKKLRVEFQSVEGRIFVYGVRANVEKRRCTATVQNPSCEVSDAAS